MPRVYTYNNTFDDDAIPGNLNGAIRFRNSGPSGVGNDTNSGDPDREYLVYAAASGSTGARSALDLEANITGSEQVTDFTSSMSVDFTQFDGAYGDGETDGISFSLGDPNSLRAKEEQGVNEGLTVRIAPFDFGSNVDGYPGDRLEIRWNGDIIGTTIVTANMSALPPSTFTVSVTDTGVVSANFAGYAVGGTIPGTEWTTTSQDGWDFIIAGRTGDNSGRAAIDDVDITAAIMCFASGTRIMTREGPRAVETLRAGDAVLTRDRGYQPIRWVGHRMVSVAAQRANPKLAPIRISAGAFGHGQPRTDLWLSRQHRVLVASKIATRLFGHAEVLVPAVKLLALEGVTQEKGNRPVAYWHLLLDHHAIVYAEGAAAETLHPGPEAIRALGPKARREITAALPGALTQDPPRPLARYVPDTGAQMRDLVARHAKHQRPLCPPLPPQVETQSKSHNEKREHQSVSALNA
ncbi:MAG: Hint domain-containing protein [Sulfitobacter sp.]